MTVKVISEGKLIINFFVSYWFIIDIYSNRYINEIQVSLALYCVFNWEKYIALYIFDFKKI